jgi:hypothetical protein
MSGSKTRTPSVAAAFCKKNYSIEGEDHPGVVGKIGKMGKRNSGMEGNQPKLFIIYYFSTINLC